MNTHCVASIRGLSLLAAALVLIGGLIPAASAQSVDAVINEMKKRYQQQLETVDTYVVKTNQYTSYHRKVTRDGEAVYETEIRGSTGARLPGGMGATSVLQPGLSQLDSLAQHAAYAGTETVDGRETHVLLIDDPIVLSGARPAPPGDMQGRMKLYIDASRYVPLRMGAEMQVEQDGQTRAMHPRIRFSDYRTTDGLTLPWIMEMRMNKANASMSPEERAEARKRLEEMEAQMKEMPAEQREMMEGMMKNQLEQLREVLVEGTIDFTVEVQNVQVNTPLPDGVFGDDG